MTLRASDYSSWREHRLAARLDEAGPSSGQQHLLITVVVYGGPEGLATTLRSLLEQTYRNIEVLVVGGTSGDADLEGAFISFRGLFFEPTISYQDVLRGSHRKGIWRGQYLMFAQAGTLFDADAFALFNSSLQTPPGADCFDLLLCDFDRVTEAGTFAQPAFTPGWDPDFIQCFPYIETAFLASRGLVMRHQWQASTCVDLHNWLCLVAKREVRLKTCHVTESLVHIPPAESPVAPDSGGRGTHARSEYRRRRDRAQSQQPQLLAQCLGFLELAKPISYRAGDRRQCERRRRGPVAL